ncbi:MAG TPA: histidinol dehydrogenase [Candidatus Sulfotelmatobacter sp.]
MRIFSGPEASEMIERVAARGQQVGPSDSQAQRIVNEVRQSGDSALRRFAEQWDGLRPQDDIKISKQELTAARRSLTASLRVSIREAAENIRRFCELQKPRSWTRSRAGITLGQIVKPMESVGCYIPGGRYPLLSTVLMTVIPAQVAGLKQIRVVSPNPSREVLGVAAMLGVREFYRIGGAQAIAALAYGTESIPRVQKIVGPGNAYVTAAKRLVAFDCAIDFLAGPTEAVILSDRGKPDFIASDLIAQAEHDVDALVFFITTSRKLAHAVVQVLEQLAQGNPTAKLGLEKGGVFIASSKAQARDWTNRVAPEHITVDEEYAPFIQNAGSIFVGDYSAQAAGDYASGPNHVLPTAGQARFRGGLSVLDFVKIISLQKLSRRGLQSIAPAIECLATAEGLHGHADSIRVRRADA